MNPPKKLIWITLLLLIGASTAVVILNEEKLPPAIEIVTNGHPTIGYPKALVRVVVIEEPKCSDCQRYNNFVFPVIKKDYIDTNKIQYTVIPVSFLPHSMPAAIALLCAYHQDPKYPNSDLFFDYLDTMYKTEPDEHTDWVTTPALVAMAKQSSSSIDTNALTTCIEKQDYFRNIKKNTDYGRTILGGTIATPSVFVNGRRVDQVSIAAIKKLIDASLEEKGVAP